MRSRGQKGHIIAAVKQFGHVYENQASISKIKLDPFKKDIGTPTTFKPRLNY